MAASTQVLDLASPSLSAGEGRRLSVEVELSELAFGGQTYEPVPRRVPVTLDVTRTTGRGYALRLRFDAALTGPCMRCLGPAELIVSVDAREVDQPGGIDDLTSPYVEGEVLDVEGWAQDALSLAAPERVLCRADCAGLCPVCGIDLNEAGPDHAHERPPDPRWAKLRELS